MTDEPLGPPAEPQPAPVSDAEDRPFWSMTDVLLFLGLGIPIFLVAYVIVTAPLMALGVEWKAMRILLPQFAGYAAAMIPLWLIFQSRYGRSPLEALRLPVPASLSGTALLLGVATAVLILVCGVALRTPRIHSEMEQLLQDRASIIVVAILGTTIGPLFEEVFFRGLLQPVLVARLGRAAGILIAALPFAQLHGPQYSWSWRHVVLITLAGSIFGVMRLRTRSTGAAALMHAAYNLTLFAGYVAGRAMESDVPQSV